VAYDYNSPDCPVSHPQRTRRSRETKKGDVAIIHRTVRSAAKSTGDAWQLQRSEGGTGLSGVHRTVFCASTGPELQWSTVLDLEGNRAPDRVQ
jgi:hypothetical protein